MYQELLFVATLACTGSAACGAEFVRQLNQPDNLGIVNSAEETELRLAPTDVGEHAGAVPAIETQDNGEQLGSETQSLGESKPDEVMEGLPDPHNVGDAASGDDDESEIGTLDGKPVPYFFEPGEAAPTTYSSSIVPAIVGYAELYLEVPFHSQVLISNQDSPRDYYVKQQGGHRALLVPIRRSKPARIGIAVNLSDARTSESPESSYQVLVDMKPGDRRHVRVSRKQMEERIQMKHLMGATAFASQRASFDYHAGQIDGAATSGCILGVDAGSPIMEPIEGRLMRESQPSEFGTEDFDGVPAESEEASELPEAPPEPDSSAARRYRDDSQLSEWIVRVNGS